MSARAAGLGLLLLVSTAAAQAPPPNAAPRAAEGSAVAPDTLRPRAFDVDVLARYRADPDFQYDRPQADGPTLGERFWAWIRETLLDPLFAGATSRPGTSLLILGLLALAAWVLTRLLREGGGVFRRTDPVSAVGPLLDVDAIEDVALAPLLAQALAEGRLRDAVRYRFLLVLQRLDGAGAIAWRRDKTNRDYVREMAPRGAAGTAFADAARAFDYVWYGERPVDAPRYARLDPLFARAEDGALLP